MIKGFIYINIYKRYNVGMGMLRDSFCIPIDIYVYNIILNEDGWK